MEVTAVHGGDSCGRSPSVDCRWSPDSGDLWQEPLEELCQWAHKDTEEFYRRGEGWMNWTDEEADAFHAWKVGRRLPPSPLDPLYTVAPLSPHSPSPAWKVARRLSHPPPPLFRLSKLLAILSVR